MNLSDKAIFPLGFGTARLRSVNGGISARSAAALLGRAFEDGIRFFDTAPSYGQGQAEEAIGRLCSRARHEVFICSKVGYSYGRRGAAINVVKPLIRSAASFAPS